MNKNISYRQSLKGFTKRSPAEPAPAKAGFTLQTASLDVYHAMDENNN
jgi:hypothetical protein